MEYKLTCHVQGNKKCKDGKSRSFIIYFLNGVQILKQKLPYDETYEKGYDHRTSITDEYILNGSMYQTRRFEDKVRSVNFPLSKRKLLALNVPNDLMIKL